MNGESEILRIDGLHKWFAGANGTAVQVLDDISLSASVGEFLVIRGPNGCGKTTLMSLIGGLDSPSQGTIEVDGIVPRSVRIGHLFQDYAASLLPWMTLGKNAALPLRLKGIGGSTRRKTLFTLASKIGFDTQPLDKYPYQTSGGQQQKACLLRAIIASERFMILDEPFSALDRISKEQVFQWLQRTRLARSSTVLIVVHDLDEAILLADRIVCLDGKPASIRDVIPVNLPWPRGPSLRVEDDFLRLRSRVLASSGELHL